MPDPAPAARLGQDRACQSVEPDHVREHGQEGGPGHIAALREDRRQRRAAPLEAATQVRQAETHVARVRRHPEARQEPGEEGIGPLVVDQEAGVGGNRSPGEVDGHRMRVPARPAVGLEEVHLVPVLQQVGRRHAGDTAPDDADAQGVPSGGCEFSTKLA